MDAPQSLLDAKALVSRELRIHPTDSGWLHVSARIDLLEWDFKDAIDILRRIQRDSSDPSAVQRDLASAYFERAEATSRAADYGMAAEILGEILKQNPRD